ncbi:MAG: hypothetical protein JW913_06060 [Chitinispirillaceae bacterium]|nr:hypothetical protein [Chitinispirillaceae bacterium]
MMLAGYNDDVYLDPEKKGAFLLVNSYGGSFGASGTIGIPCDKFVTETEVYLLEVVKHVPRLEFKIEPQTYCKAGAVQSIHFVKSISLLKLPSFEK